MAFFTSTPAKTTSAPIFSPEQNATFDQLRQMGQQGLQNQNQFNFDPIAQKARTQFNSQTIPSIAERFQSMGGPNSSDRGGSALTGQLGAAGAGLEEGLAALKSQYGFQNQGQQNQLFQNLLGLGLTPQTQNFYTPEQPSFVENAGNSVLSFLPQLIGASAGGSGGLLGLLSMLLGGGQNNSPQQQQQNKLGPSAMNRPNTQLQNYGFPQQNFQYPQQ